MQQPIKSIGESEANFDDVVKKRIHQTGSEFIPQIASTILKKQHPAAQEPYRVRVLPGKEVSVDISSPERSGMGLIIGKMYYSTRLSDLFGSLSSGYPHNGGEHTLYFKGPYQDVIAALELIRDLTPVPFHPMVVEARMDLTMLCSKIAMMVESKYGR